MELLEGRGLDLWPPNERIIKKFKPESLTVIIRAHGLSPKAEKELRAFGIKVVDATCPRVARVQQIVAEEVTAGGIIVIWGSAGHPEVEGLLGYCHGRGQVASSPYDFEKLPNFKRVLLVAQTTQDARLWPLAAEAFKKRFPFSRAINTICLATVNRQDEARRLATECDALVVVGGKDSGNTKRLYEISLNCGAEAICIEDPSEIDSQFVSGRETIGLVAGASTPQWQIRAAVQRLKALSRAKTFSPLSFIQRLSRALVLSSIYTGLGAGCLGLAWSRIAGYHQPSYFFGLFFFYVQAMHLLNGYLVRASARINDPDRADFLNKYKPYLVLSGLSSTVLALTASYLAGPKVLAIILFLSFLGLIYAVPLPLPYISGKGFSRLMDLPLSKTLSISLGWAFLLTAPVVIIEPAFFPLSPPLFAKAGYIFGAIFFNLLCRTIIMDFQEAIGDRMFGRRTPVTVLGWKGAEKLLIGCLIFWTLYLVLGGLLAFKGGPLWLIIISGPLYNAAALPRLYKNPGLGGYSFDLALDFQFILTWLLVWLWSIL
jgi:4-hydroxy-3-methylbut-2-enyl diphosphate reductase